MRSVLFTGLLAGAAIAGPSSDAASTTALAVISSSTWTDVPSSTILLSSETEVSSTVTLESSETTTTDATTTTADFSTSTEAATSAAETTTTGFSKTTDATTTAAISTTTDFSTTTEATTSASETTTTTVEESGPLETFAVVVDNSQGGPLRGPLIEGQVSEFSTNSNYPAYSLTIEPNTNRLKIAQGGYLCAGWGGPTDPDQPGMLRYCSSAIDDLIEYVECTQTDDRILECSAMEETCVEDGNESFACGRTGRTMTQFLASSHGAELYIGIGVVGGYSAVALKAIPVV